MSPNIYFYSCFNMEFHLLQLVLAIVTLVVMASHAASPPELYWNSVLPNTQMPKAIRTSIKTNGGNENFATRINTYKIKTEHVTGIDALNIGYGRDAEIKTDEDKIRYNHDGKIKTDAVNIGYGRNAKIKTDEDKIRYNHDAKIKTDAVNIGYGRNAKIKTDEDKIRYNHDAKIKTDAVNIGYGRHAKIKPGNTFGIDTDKIKTQFDPNFDLFFLEKDLYVGKTMNLDFSPFRNKATFLPRQIADSTPFSSNKLPEIYSMFAVKPKSKEAEALEETIKTCEMAADEGEEKYCASSLESMIEFVRTKLGKSVRPMATEMSTTTVQYQKYRVASGVKKVTDKKAAICHKLDYPYAVFYCHTIPNTEVYAIPLVAADGTKVDAAAVCHVDTASWNPKHLAFEILQVKPGTAPVCHFLEQYNIVWVRN